jgi:hypothetical protein
MAWDLAIDLPADRRAKRATVTVTDSKGGTLLTDRADLSTIADRQRLAKRLAKRLKAKKQKATPAGIETRLEELWAQADAARRQAQAEQDAPAAEGQHVFTRVERKLQEQGPASLYCDPDLLREIAQEVATAPAAHAAVRELVRRHRGAVRQFDQVLLPLVREARGAAPSAGGEKPSPYTETPSGIVWRRATPAGEVDVLLTNFTARIVADVTEDDGAEVRHCFEIEAALKGRTSRFLVPADRFTAMNWPTEHLGAEAIIYPGQSLRDHARCAVQVLSGAVPARTVYRHTGWRPIGGEPVYLHAGGGIGRECRVCRAVEVSLPAALAHYTLPQPPSGEARVAAVRASLNLLQLATPRISLPLLCAVPRAALCPADFYLWVAGPTHEGKTEVSARILQHWGPQMDSRRLPANWSSTANALESLAHAAKDAVLLVDDYVANGTATDQARIAREADRFLRAQGNNAGRHRLSRDTSLRPEKFPRGLTISTGEDVPPGQSLRARGLILDVGPGDVDWSRMNAAQADGARGLYAQALAGFIQWVATSYTEVQERFRNRVEELRVQAAGSGLHRRTPVIVAHLFAAWELWLEYAVGAAAVTADEAADLRTRCWAALGEAAAAQARYQAASEPCRRYLELLSAAIACGRAHVASREGRAPKSPDAWGWREASSSTSTLPRGDHRPQGELVGWIDGEDLFLEPDASYAVVQTLGRDGGDALNVSAITLRRRLKDRGLLRSIDAGRETLTVRRVLGGQQRHVLHVSARALGAGSPDKPDIPDMGAASSGGATTRSLTGETDPRTARHSESEAGQALAGEMAGMSGLSGDRAADGRDGAQRMSGCRTTPTTDPGNGWTEGEV